MSVLDWSEEGLEDSDLLKKTIWCEECCTIWKAIFVQKQTDIYARADAIQAVWQPGSVNSDG